MDANLILIDSAAELAPPARSSIGSGSRTTLPTSPGSGAGASDRRL